ncbi:MAG: hypothetical protein DRI52_06485 [Chloroflexi bacterium]|nr:hypothetical protein [Anaerolineae bacterium]RLC70745.1 MAG: hypothetical protein DRI52_06485 [Chloroflexota bacterium]
MDQNAGGEKRSWEFRRHPDDREVDVELLAFVERYATGLLKWDIITFFGQNPHTHDTALNIAHFIGRNPRAVMLDLGDLAILGLLRQTRANGEIVYHLTSDRVLRGAILRFVSHVAR